MIASGSGIITEYDNYDLLHEDLEWFKEYMASYEAEDDHPTPTDDTMEKLIDMFEKETGKLTRNVPSSFAFRTVQSCISPFFC